MAISGAKLIVELLESEGVKVIFGYPGAANAPIYDALSHSKIKHILTRSEQGAAHAASGYARTSSKVGVCMATSGPGATNLITGIATAYMDSIPIVAITVQVSRDLIGKDAFQEADITGATAPFCKHNYLVKNICDLPRIIKEAFYISITGRPGPVLIDIPIDIQFEKMDKIEKVKLNIKGYNPKYIADTDLLQDAITLIEKAEKPVIISGGGVITSGASELLCEFSKVHSIPAVTTLMGVGAFTYNNPNYFGMLGTHGSFSANHLVNMSDLWLVIGARLSDRAIANASKKNVKVIHIDIDPAEIGKSVETHLEIVGDAKTVLGQINDLTGGKNLNKADFFESVSSIKKEKKFTFLKDYINPKYAMSLLSKKAPGSSFIATEVGQNQIWTANNFEFSRAGQFLTSGGLGTMGYGLPCAIGAKASHPDKEVFVIAGDGSFQMNLQELGTICQWKIDVKIIIFNNNRLGMVRELQKQKYNSNYFSVNLDGSPDFIKLAKAYGIEGEKISQNEDLDKALDRLIDYKGTYILDLFVHPEESSI